MPFWGLTARKELRLWRIVWYAGALLAIGYWCTYRVMAEMNMLWKGSPGAQLLVPAELLTIGWMLLACAGLCSFWMARLPGGLKGWRLGLLLLWPVSYLWRIVECFRCSYGLLRGGSRWRMAAALICAGLIPVSAFGYLYSVALPKFPLLIPNCLWVLFFAGLDRLLSPVALRREVIPTSAGKRRFQLALVLGIGYAAWAVGLVFMLSLRS